MLDTEYAYFLKNQEKWSQEHHGKFIVLAGESVFGIFDNEEEAFTVATKELGEGMFLIQQCLYGEDSFTQTFYSRVLIK